MVSSHHLFLLLLLQDLFFQYPWNNFLHTYVEASVTAALSLNSSVPMDTNDDTGQSDDSITLRQHVSTTY